MNPYLIWLKIGAAVGVIVFAFVTGHSFGASGVQADWNLAKLNQSEATRQAVDRAVRENEIKHAQNIRFNGELLATYEARQHETNAALDRARLDADRLRLAFKRPKQPCTAAGELAAGAGLPDDPRGSETIELPPAITAELYDLASDADREVSDLHAKLALFREWARKHGFSPAIPQP